MTVTEFLRRHVPLFEGIDSDLAQSMARRVEQRVFKKGQTVFFRGAIVDGLHVVASGKVSVLARVPGGQPVKIADVGPGEVVGEMSIVEHGTACATIRSEEDETMILVLPQQAFRALLHFNPYLEQRTLDLIDSRRKAAPAPKKVPEPAR